MTEYAQNISRTGPECAIVYQRGRFYFETLFCVYFGGDWGGGGGRWKDTIKLFPFLFSSTNQKHEWG
jgi:hypothetical protein